MKNINIIIAILLTWVLVSSCEPEPPDKYTNYIINNVSNHNVKLLIFYNWFDDSNNDSLIVISKNTEIKNTYINSTPIIPFGLAVDSLYIHFNENRRIIYRKNDEHLRNILDINSYDVRKNGNYLYEYEYTITDEDYDNAVNIE